MEWISVEKDGLPKGKKLVAVIRHYIDAELDMKTGGYKTDRKGFPTEPEITLSKCGDGKFSCSGVVTHWFPLPNPPKCK